MSAPSGTVTFMFTDIEVSTRLWQADEAAMRSALYRHDEFLRRAIADHDGSVFSTMGDGMAGAFSSASAAVSASLTAQQLFEAETWPTATPIKVRMGIHTGEADARNGDYFGTTVNRTARLMAIGHVGQVLCSSATAEILGDSVALVDLGEHRLRDLDRPMHVFEVTEGTFPALRSLDSFMENLPLQVSSFVGRERELARGIKALGSSRLVTLTGVGGVGKTRLALQLAAEVLPRFRDGAWLVELAPVREPECVADAVASLFRLSGRTEQSIDEALVDFLRAKQMLLILDNCERLLDAVAGLVERVERSCGGLVVLATSRERLALDGERVMGLNGRAARRNHQAITTGQAKSGRIIAAAAGIMILVFGSFILGNQQTLKEFGLGLAASVLIDAVVIRGLPVPATMHLIGPANWAMPAWLDRLLPNLSVEVNDEPETATEAKHPVGVA
jgi:class 3 adenylate cyclase